MFWHYTVLVAAQSQHKLKKALVLALEKAIQMQNTKNVIPLIPTSFYFVIIFVWLQMFMFSDAAIFQNNSCIFMGVSINSQKNLQRGLRNFIRCNLVPQIRILSISARRLSVIHTATTGTRLRNKS